MSSTVDPVPGAVAKSAVQTWVADTDAHDGGDPLLTLSFKNVAVCGESMV